MPSRGHMFQMQIQSLCSFYLCATDQFTFLYLFFLQSLLHNTSWLLKRGSSAAVPPFSQIHPLKMSASAEQRCSHLLCSEAWEDELSGGQMWQADTDNQSTSRCVCRPGVSYHRRYNTKGRRPGDPDLGELFNHGCLFIHFACRKTMKRINQYNRWPDFKCCLLPVNQLMYIVWIHFAFVFFLSSVLSQSVHKIMVLLTVHKETLAPGFVFSDFRCF